MISAAQTWTNDALQNYHLLLTQELAHYSSRRRDLERQLLVTTERTEQLMRRFTRNKSSRLLAIVRNRRRLEDCLRVEIRDAEWNNDRISRELYLVDIYIRQRSLLLNDAHQAQAPMAESNAKPSATEQAAMVHVTRVFQLVSLFVPKRLANEEIGDALEVMTNHFKRSSSRWPVYLKLATTVFWIGINTIRQIIASLNGSKQASGE